MLQKPIGLILDSPLQTQLVMFQIIQQVMFFYLIIHPKYQDAIFQTCYYEYFYLPSTTDPIPLNKYLQQKDLHTSFESLSLYQKFKIFMNYVWLGKDTKGRSYSYDTFLTLAEKKPDKIIDYAKSMYRYAFFASFIDPASPAMKPYIMLFLNASYSIVTTVIKILQGIGSIEESILDMGGIFEIINKSLSLS
jgi:hypothetical protein